ncbi:restriction endonuclease subunit S [Flavobacterium sp. N1719]|uniref:restriction endonuclease subunit S n=1 Tax=Flavobacterium sp. N1719 TaxID=2885633 RepID=UPI0022221A5D|nr:restriction endonuclease subunit S [Flavobacterium sp. N1719]
MKKYDSYKDSGIEWIGVIPSHWNTKRLKFIGNLYSGLSGKSGADFSSEASSSTKPFINFTNVANNKYIVSDNFGHVIMTDNENQNQVQKGDLLFLMSSENQEEVGKSALLNNDFGELYLNSFCKGLRISNLDIYPNFLNYLLNSSTLSQLVSIEGRGFTRINLRMEGVQNLPVFFPDKDEQITIANYLDHKTTQIDDLIAKKERLIQLLEEERTAIINQAVTKGLDTTVPMKDSGIEWLGEIPAHWEVKRMRYLSDITTGGKDTENREDDGIYPFYVRSQTVERISTYSFDGEAILTAGDGVGVCKVWHYVNEKFDFHQRVYMLSNFRGVLGKYLFYYLKENFGKEVMKLSAKSTVDSLRRPMFQNFLVCFGTIEEQNEIIHTIEKEEYRIQTIIEKTQQEIELLKEYKTALISEVVTGKVDVREEVLN